MVSIIVPVYNTEKYLDKCIRSILCQTYENLEIILINDGSTDRSLEILENYRARDNRVQVISVENGGQGRARNIGIERASGEFLMFVDSDDWISEDCVETLYAPMTDTQCDIVIGNIAQTYFEKEDIQYILQHDVVGFVEKDKKKELVFQKPIFSFAKLYRKSLFTKHNIYFPECFFEDIATIPLTYIIADKIYCEDRAIYYYRCRNGSTVNSVKSIYDRIRCLALLEERLRQRNVYNEYKELFTLYALQRSRINRVKAKKLLTKEYCKFERQQLMFDYQHFGRFEEITPASTYVYGSYNLMIAIKIFMCLKKEESVPNYFGFQNIISCMSPKKKVLGTYTIPTGSEFRRKLLLQDFRKDFFSLKPAQFENIDYFILDFLEERFYTGCIGEEYFTLSDAFKDNERLLEEKYTIIKSFSPEWENIWFSKCNLFIQHLKNLICEERVILVKTKLSEKYVDNGLEYPFADIDVIRDVNNQLEKCYGYFERLCPKALVVDIENLEHFYTDKEFRHGCFPWHLNDVCYRDIAKEIKKKVNHRKYEQMILEEQLESKGQ